MRRRDALRAGAGALALPFAGAVAARTDSPQRSTYAPSGSIPIEGAAEAVVDGTGETVFLATSTGFATVDVSDPADPTVLAERRDPLADVDGGPLEGILDVKYDDDRLIVPGPANRGRFTAFGVYDVSDPASPERIGYRETPSSIHNCYFRDGIVYITGNGEPNSPMIAYDVTGDAIEEVGRWSPVDADDAWSEFAGLILHDLYVHDGIAYCAYWDAGTFLVDVSDVSSPTLLSRAGDYSKEELLEWSSSRVRRDYYEPRGNAHYVAVDEDASLMAVGGESWDLERGDDTGGPSGIDLYDVSDPAAPESLSRIRAPKSGNNTYRGTWTTSHNFDLADGRLYTSWYQGGVKVFDVSDPRRPAQIAWWRNPDAAFWTARRAGSRDFFVASAHKAGGGQRQGLFTFPDRAGSQADPPEGITNPDPLVVRPPFDDDSRTTTTATPTDTTATRTTTTGGDGTTASGTPGGGDGTTTGGTPNGGDGTTAAGTTTTTSARTGTTGTATDGGGATPGFGVGAALAALGLGAWRTLRSDDGEE